MMSGGNSFPQHEHDERVKKFAERLFQITGRTGQVIITIGTGNFRPGDPPDLRKRQEYRRRVRDLNTMYQVFQRLGPCFRCNLHKLPVYHRFLSRNFADMQVLVSGSFKARLV